MKDLQDRKGFHITGLVTGWDGITRMIGTFFGWSYEIVVLEILPEVV